MRIKEIETGRFSIPGSINETKALQRVLKNVLTGSNPSVPTFTKIVIIGGNPARTDKRHPR